MIIIQFNKEDLIKSPINYTGGKYRLLPKLLPYFPDKINTFVDLFCGAGTVGVNINANKIILNDYINYLPEMFKMWQSKSIDEIEGYIEETISKFKLSPHDDNAFKEFRNHYNTYKNIEDLFILICHSFNYQMRFNNNQQYNSSFGKTASTMNDSIRNNLRKFVNVLHTKNIEATNKDFRELNIDKLSIDDLAYCDPPYSITCGVYQDGKRGFKGWNKQDDLDLFNLLDKLNDKGVKFAMSNMVESKGNTNEELLEWAKKYNINYLNMNYNGCNYQRKVKSKDIEVLITNY